MDRNPVKTSVFQTVLDFHTYSSVSPVDMLGCSLQTDNACFSWNPKPQQMHWLRLKSSHAFFLKRPLTHSTLFQSCILLAGSLQVLLDRTLSVHSVMPSPAPLLTWFSPPWRSMFFFYATVTSPFLVFILWALSVSVEESKNLLLKQLLPLLLNFIAHISR